MKIVLSFALSATLIQGAVLQNPSTPQQLQSPEKTNNNQNPDTTTSRSTLAFGLEDGTPVKLRISRTISSEDAQVGDVVDFEVLDEIKCKDVVVIPRGGIAWATVTEAQSKRRMGRAGKLNINIDNVKLTDGEKAPLRAVKEVKGGSHVGAMTGAIVATSIVFFPAAPLFLLMKGKDITIPKGTEITAYVSGDISLDPKKFQPQDTAKVTVQTGENPSSTITIELRSTPDGADIMVDGKYVGNTPTTLHPAAGDHLVRMEKPGFKVWERTLTITPGEATSISPTLEKNE